ncbi:MAG: DUF2334 domain-containing protein [Treponemataceae bacterium]
MNARYLIRLDDARPRMNKNRWDAVERVLDARGTKPLVAVIPACADAELDAGKAEDGDFWNRAIAWQDKGWGIALHGHEHALRPSAGGLVPLNGYSEFVGLPEEVQRKKINLGYRILTEKSLIAAWWVAPAHGFDEATLTALAKETPIRLISDGLSTRPYSCLGFTWFPQQLWKPRKMRSGFWTICLHPDEMSDEAISRLDAFLLSEGNAVLSPAEASALPIRPRGLYDVCASAILLIAKKIKRRL